MLPQLRAGASRRGPSAGAAPPRHGEPRGRAARPRAGTVSLRAAIVPGFVDHVLLRRERSPAGSRCVREPYGQALVDPIVLSQKLAAFCERCSPCDDAASFALSDALGGTRAISHAALLRRRHPQLWTRGRLGHGPSPLAGRRHRKINRLVRGGIAEVICRRLAMSVLRLGLPARRGARTRGAPTERQGARQGLHFAVGTRVRPARRSGGARRYLQSQLNTELAEKEAARPNS